MVSLVCIPLLLPHPPQGNNSLRWRWHRAAPSHRTKKLKKLVSPKRSFKSFSFFKLWVELRWTWIQGQIGWSFPWRRASAALLKASWRLCLSASWSEQIRMCHFKIWKKNEKSRDTFSWEWIKKKTHKNTHQSSIYQPLTQKHPVDHRPQKITKNKNQDWI